VCVLQEEKVVHFHSDLLLSAAPVESHIGAVVVSQVQFDLFDSCIQFYLSMPWKARKTIRVTTPVTVV
jgi:hypothetical protein